MAEITLGKSTEVKTLRVNIGEETYSVPLAGSLSIAEMKKLKTDEDSFDFFEKYIPKKVLNSLTFDDFKALTEAWKKTSSSEGGMSVGE